ncbi:hypothetical protein Tco_1515143 [Tanacetum coccineum]
MFPPLNLPTKTDEQIISVDILSNTNFFQAFTASANVPAIYLQTVPRKNAVHINEKTWVYSCQVDEQWFDLSVDLLRKALAITPVSPAHPFKLPPSGDTANSILAHQCLTGTTSAHDKPQTPSSANVVGIDTQTNIDHAELIWEEFIQGIQTFFLQSQSEEPKEESNSSPHPVWMVFQSDNLLLLGK